MGSFMLGCLWRAALGPLTQTTIYFIYKYNLCVPIKSPLRNLELKPITDKHNIFNGKRG